MDEHEVDLANKENQVRKGDLSLTSSSPTY